MPTISVDLPSEHVVPSQPEGNTTPIMVEVDQTRRTPQTSTVALQTRNKAIGSKPNQVRTSDAKQSEVKPNPPI